jgi:putative phage-type endonuclease
MDISPNMYNLIDVTNLIVPEEDPKYFNEEESFELYQTCIYLMEEFIKNNNKIITDPDFDDIFDENILELIQSHFDSDIFYNEEAEEELEDIISHAKTDFFKDFIPPRSYSDTIILTNPDHTYIDKQLEILRNKPQPTQRTKEWYEFRHNLITASNAYKAFENQTTQNQLIYEKCQPLNKSLYIDGDDECELEDIKIIKEVNMVNTNTTLHWGQKYEPLSVKIYEYMYNTKVEDFGCIQHEKYLFLGASPDGIIVNPESQRYGRMLEIKNIVNREIDGIPKKEYWIQMQLQMEVCDLNECDFLETKFTEYTDKNYYYDDTLLSVTIENGKVFTNVCLSKDYKMKGEIIYFHTKEGKPFYIYKPLELINIYDIEKWEENTIDYYQNNPEFKYTFMKIIYWKLDIVSCVLVCRNKLWFKENINEMAELWKTIEKERITGYENRAPNRKPKKENVVNLTTASSGGCLLRFNKDTDKITVIKNDN